MWPKGSHHFALRTLASAAHVQVVRDRRCRCLQGECAEAVAIRIRCGVSMEKLMLGMSYLAERHETTGCLSLRIMANFNEDGSAQGEILA